jgi:fimbrial chaperone protein
MAFRRAPVLIAALLALVALSGAPARAGALSVMPVRVDVAAGRRFCSLTLGNGSDRPVTVQVRAFAWARAESGTDALDPEPGFVLNPAIATIAPGGSRLVRCSLPAAEASAPAERQWRLIIDQLPDPDFAEPGTVQTLLRISIPVFRTPAKAAPRLVATLAGKALRLANPGNAHVKVLALMLTGAGGDAVTVERPFYLLAGGAQVVPLDRLPSGARTVQVRAEESEFDLPLGPVR